MNNLKKPLRFKVKDKLLHTVLNGENEYTPLGGISSEELDVVTEEIRTKHATIKSHYRDHTDLENGSWNFISPSFRYIGWYTKSLNNTKQDHLARNKRYIEPSFSKKLFMNASSLDEAIQGLTITDILTSPQAATKISKSDALGNNEDSPIPTTMMCQPLATQRQLIGDYLLKNDLNNLKDAYGITKSIKSRSIDAFYTMNIFTNIYDNYSTYDFTTFQNVPLTQNGLEMSIVLIDWATIPEDSYMIAGLLKDKINYEYAVYIKDIANPDKEITTTMLEDIKANIYKTPLVDDNYYKLLENEEPFYDGYYKFKRNDKLKAKKRYTYILIISKGPTSKPSIDASNGLFFNFYFPEKYYFEVVRGLYDTKFKHIYDGREVGRMYNGLHNYNDDMYYPTFLRQNDEVAYIDKLTKDDIKEDKYIVMQGASLQGLSEEGFRSASKDKHFNIGYARYPLGKALINYFKPDSEDEGNYDNVGLKIAFINPSIFYNKAFYYLKEKSTREDGEIVASGFTLKQLEYIRHFRKIEISSKSVPSKEDKGDKEFDFKAEIDYYVLSPNSNYVKGKVNSFKEFIEQTQGEVEKYYIEIECYIGEILYFIDNIMYEKSISNLEYISVLKNIFISKNIHNISKEDFPELKIKIISTEIIGNISYFKKAIFHEYDINKEILTDLLIPPTGEISEMVIEKTLKTPLETPETYINDYEAEAFEYIHNNLKLGKTIIPVLAGITYKEDKDSNASMELNPFVASYYEGERELHKYTELKTGNSLVSPNTPIDWYISKPRLEVNYMTFLPVLSIRNSNKLSIADVLNSYSYHYMKNKSDITSTAHFIQNYVDNNFKKYSEEVVHIANGSRGITPIDIFSGISLNENLSDGYVYRSIDIFTDLKYVEDFTSFKKDTIIDLNNAEGDTIFIDILQKNDGKMLNSDANNKFKAKVIIEYLSEDFNNKRSTELELNENRYDFIVSDVFNVYNDKNTMYNGDYSILTYKLSRPLGFITKVTLQYITPIEENDIKHSII